MNPWNEIYLKPWKKTIEEALTIIRRMACVAPVHSKIEVNMLDDISLIEEIDELL